MSMEPTKAILKQVQHQADSDQPAVTEKSRSDQLPSIASPPKRRGHLRSISLDANRVSNSFGARFSKVPSSIFTSGANRDEAVTRGPALGTFHIERHSKPTKSQALLHESQDEQSADASLITQHQNLPEWRKLPEPVQTRQALQPTDLARYLPPNNMANEIKSQQDLGSLQARYEPKQFSSGTIEAIANRVPLADIPAKSVHRPLLPIIQNADPGISKGGDLEIHRDQQNTQPGNSFVLRSTWRSGQETRSGYASSAQPSPHGSSVQLPGNPSELVGGTNPYAELNFAVYMLNSCVSTLKRISKNVSSQIKTLRAKGRLFSHLCLETFSRMHPQYLQRTRPVNQDRQ